MQKPFWRNSITFLFFSTFFILRVANAHSLLHISDHENMAHCGCCDIITTTHKFTPILNHNPRSLEIYIASDHIIRNIYPYYDIPIQAIASPAYVYNKPPPYDPLKK